MKKRIVTTAMWAFTGWWIGALLTGAIGVPLIWSLIPATVLGALVYWDPTNVLWARTRSSRSTVSADTFAATLGSDAERSAAGTDRAHS